jgi:hypothetical protein
MKINTKSRSRERIYYGPNSREAGELDTERYLHRQNMAVCVAKLLAGALLTPPPPYGIEPPERRPLIAAACDAADEWEGSRLVNPAC